MATTRLRVYYGPEKHASEAPEGMKMSLGEFLPILAEAIINDQIWIYDFADDEITVSPDLYELIQAYRHYRRPSA